MNGNSQFIGSSSEGAQKSTAETIRSNGKTMKSRRPLKSLLGLAALMACAMAMIGVMPATGQVINLVSGDGVAVGNQDPLTTFNGGSQENPLTGSGPGGLFNATDFNLAASGSEAWVVTNYPGWLNPATSAPFNTSGSQWISTTYTSGGGGAAAPTALYAQTFTLTLGPGYTQPVGFPMATLDFYWAADDALGDPNDGSSGANTVGVYINGYPVAQISPDNGDVTGLYTECRTVFSVTDIPIYAPVLQNGTNILYVYNRDLHGVAAGVIYDGVLTIVPEPSSLALVGIGLAALVAARRWMKK